MPSRLEQRLVGAGRVVLEEHDHDVVARPSLSTAPLAKSPMPGGSAIVDTCRIGVRGLSAAAGAPAIVGVGRRDLAGRRAAEQPPFPARSAATPRCRARRVRSSAPSGRREARCSAACRGCGSPGRMPAASRSRSARASRSSVGTRLALGAPPLSVALAVEHAGVVERGVQQRLHLTPLVGRALADHLARRRRRRARRRARRARRSRPRPRSTSRSGCR